MNVRALILGLVLTACSSGVAPAPTPTPTPVATPPSAPCATHADCRLYDGPACSCHVALTTASVPPSMTPCFAPPCMEREAYCDDATHQCAIRALAPPPSSVPPSAPSDLTPES
jgi:hypothetical protein